MNREDDQQLWDLLDRARPVQVSPFFARNVVRQIRQRTQGVEWLHRLFTRGKLIPATGLAMALLAAILVTHRPAFHKSTDDMPDSIAAIDPQDYDVVADLDELMAADENNLWDDDAQTL